MPHATPSEILLALRSPDSGWLGVLACVIDEASRDAQFDPRQRALALEMLQHGPLPTSVVESARLRAACFEAELSNDSDFNEPSAEEAAPSRPNLTLVGSKG